MTDVTIIMVTFNSAHLIADALDEAPQGYAVIVVDNASSDETCAAIKAHKRSGVKLIRNKENLGFGTANNIAFRQCKTRYALLLNPDAKIKAADLRKLQATLEADDKAVLAGPLIKEKGKINYRFQPYPLFHRKNPLFRPLFGDRSKYRRLSDLSKPQLCGFISGAVMLYDLHKTPKPFYFDEDIRLYYDESEWQARMIAAGYRVLLEPRASAEHIGGASSHWQDEEARIRLHFYHTGYSRGLLAAKYPGRFNRFDMARFARRAQLLAWLSRGNRRVKYRARLQGLEDGYQKGRGRKQ